MNSSVAKFSVTNFARQSWVLLTQRYLRQLIASRGHRHHAT